MTIVELDKEIMRVQQSTKTTFRQFAGVHNYCRMKSRLYYRWHLNNLASAIHWSVLGVFVFVVAAFGLTFSKPENLTNPPETKAATSWVVAGTGNASYNGTYSLVGNDLDGNPYYTNGTRYLGFYTATSTWGLFSQDDSSAYWGISMNELYRGTGSTLPANSWGQGPGLGASPYPYTGQPLGYTTAGSAGSTYIAGSRAGSTFTASENGTINSITAYVNVDFASGYGVNAAIYRHSDGVKIAQSSNVILSSLGNQWVTMPMTASITSGTEYVIMMQGELVGWDVYLYYDAGSANQGHTEGSSPVYDIWPDPISPSHNNYKYSIYALYNPTGGSTPTAPTIGTPEAVDTDTIRWKFTDNSSDETGFRVYDSGDNLVATCATAGISYCDENSLSANTQYTGRYVVAYNGTGESTHSATASSTYTKIETPTGLDASGITTSSITLSAVGTLSNLASGSSGIRYCNTTTSSCSSWQQTTDSYTFSSLSAATAYDFSLESRNGDGVSGGTALATATTTSGSTPDPEPEPVPTPAEVTGCTNNLATNYNSSATEDDGSCKYNNDPNPYRFLSLNITPNPASLYRGGTTTFVPQVTFAGSDISGSCTFKWQMLKSGAGTIDENSGNFTASQTAGLWSDSIKATATCGQDSVYGFSGVSIITDPRRLDYAYISPYAPPVTVQKGIDPDSFIYTISGRDQYFVGFTWKQLTYGFSLLDPLIGTSRQQTQTNKFSVQTSNNYGCYFDKVKASATYDRTTKDVYTSVNIALPQTAENTVGKPSGPVQMKTLGMSNRRVFRPGESFSFGPDMRDQYGEHINSFPYVFSMADSGAGSISKTGQFIASGSEGTHKKAIKLTASYGGIDKTVYSDVTISSEKRKATKVTYYYPSDLGKTATIRLAPQASLSISAYLYDQFGDIVIYESGDKLELNNTSAPFTVDSRNITSTGTEAGFYKDAIKLKFAWPDYPDPDKRVDGPSPEILLSVDVSPNYAVDPKSCLASGGTAFEPVFGCMNPQATNYNDQATVDDGSCKFADTNPGPIEKIEIPWLPDIVNDFINSLLNSPITRAVVALTAAAAAVIALAVAPLSNVVSIYSLPEIAHIFNYSVLSAGLARRRNKKWGRVVEDGTGIPLVGVMVSLVKVNEDGTEKTIETAYTDKKGAYGFAAPPGNYKVVASKDKYYLASGDNQYYDFKPERVYKIEKYDEGLIIPTIVLAMSNKKITGIYKTLIFLKKLERIMNWISVAVLLVGSIAIGITLSRELTSFNIIIAAGYVLLWIVNIMLLLRHSPWSTVQEKDSKKPISLSIVRITDAKSNKLVRTTVSDEKGKFSAILKKGNFNIYAAKEGYRLDHPLEVDTKEEITALQKKIEMNPN